MTGVPLFDEHCCVDFICKMWIWFSDCIGERGIGDKWIDVWAGNVTKFNIYYQANCPNFTMEGGEKVYKGVVLPSRYTRPYTPNVSSQSPQLDRPRRQERCCCLVPSRRGLAWLLPLKNNQGPRATQDEGNS